MTTFNHNWLGLTVLIVHALSASSYVESLGGPKEMGTCAKQLQESCGTELLESVFHIEKPLSFDCCMELAAMGKTCHDELVKVTLSSSQQYQKKSKEILQRSQSIWTKCISTLHSSTPHGELCPSVGGPGCGFEIVGRICFGQQLSNDCCGMLVELGKDCHETLLREYIINRGLQSEKKAILNESTSVWNWCSNVTPSLPSMKACETKMDDKCGKEIELGIFHGKGQVAKECCLKLVELGPRCHDKWVKNVLAKPEFEKSSKVILERSTKIWKKCVLYVS